MKEETRKKMQQKMAAYKETAPEVSWAAMEKALAAGSGATTPPAYLWRRRLAVAASVLLIAGLLLLRNNGPQNQTPAIAEVQADTVKIESAPADTVEETAITAPQVKEFRKEAKTEILANIKVEEQPAIETETYPEMTKNTTQETEPLLAETTKKTPDNETIEFKGAGEEIREKSSRKLVASVFVSSLMNGSANTMESRNLMYYCAAPMGVSDRELFANNSPVLSPERKVKEKGSHRQPVRFGVSVRYPLGGGFSIDGGLTYSLLVSTIHSSLNGLTFDNEQKLNYVGIPVRVNYDLLKGNTLSLYTSAGGSVEKMVKGRREDQKISIRPLQYSLTCAAGAELRFKPFSLYVEPGLSYHFKNNCHIPTYYRDKPLGFDLSIGLRFNLE